MAIGTRIQVGVLGVTGLLVLFLGIGVFASVISFNPYEWKKPKDDLQIRKPASVKMEKNISNKSGVQMIDKKMSQLKLNCIKKDNKVSFSSLASQVQISGQLCLPTDLIKTSIVNRTNGYKAITFASFPNKFSSDYLHLADGENKILVTLEDALGESHVTELTINRHPASAE